MSSRKHRRRKRRGGNFFLSLVTFCIVVGAIITSVIVFLKVAEVEVIGETRYDPAEIIEVSGIESGDNMFLVNKFDVATRILEKYPYIEQIKIRRRLPDKFVFEITDRIPAAYIMSDGNRWLIDKNAYILEMLSENAEIKVPKVTGAEMVTPHAGSPLILKNEDRLPVLREVLTALCGTELIGNVARVEIDKLYSINIVYGDRFLVGLGDTTELSRKIKMLKAVISELTDFDKGTINVSKVVEARFKPDSNIDLSEKEPLPPVAGEEEPAQNGQENGETEENSDNARE